MPAHNREHTREQDCSRLNSTSRTAAIATMRDPKHELDVLIIGGGITGAGTALDATTRGLATGILEARDWSSGTSSRSSKLVHGGIRYLEQLNFSLVREALVERGLLLQRLAPHLVQPVGFLYPLTKPIYERLYVGAGMLIYDLFARGRGRSPGVPFHRQFSRKKLRTLAPGLRRGKFRGGLGYFDAQVDDARLVTNIVRTATHYGALAANRVRVEGFLKVGERVIGVIARDLESDEVFEIRAKQVVNATGVWTDDTQALVGERGKFQVRASKGIHIVVPRDRFNSRLGLLLRTERSVLFVIPWGRHWLIGTTDTPWNLDKAHPAATAADIDYLLGRVNEVLETPLTRDDVEGVFAGLRPLLSGESDDTSKLSREHIVTHAAPGLVVVAGGKLTTYRVMAKDTIDEAAQTLGGKIPESITEHIPLLGAEGIQAAWNTRTTLAARYGVHEARVEHLLRRYGTLATDVLDLIRAAPELAEPLPGADDYIGAEIVYAVSHEGALHLDDVLCRRTRVSIEAWDRGSGAAPTVARLMAAELGWDDERQLNEVHRYRDRVDAEIASQLQTTDEEADRVRNARP